MRADIAVHDKQGRLALVVQVKAKSGKSKDWASRMLRNTYAHGTVPRPRYFLLTLLDKLYLWRDLRDPMAEPKPDYEAETKPFMGNY